MIKKLMVREFVVKWLKEASLENQLPECTLETTKRRADHLEDTQESTETIDITDEDRTPMREIIEDDEEEMTLMILERETIKDEHTEEIAENDTIENDQEVEKEITTDEDIETLDHNSK